MLSVRNAVNCNIETLSVVRSMGSSCLLGLLGWATETLVWDTSHPLLALQASLWCYVWLYSDTKCLCVPVLRHNISVCACT